MRNCLSLLCIVCMAAAACGKNAPVEKIVDRGEAPTISGVPSEPCLIYPAGCGLSLAFLLHSSEDVSLKAVPGEGLLADVMPLGEGDWHLEVTATESLGDQSVVTVYAIGKHGETIVSFDVVKACLDAQTAEYNLSSAGASLSVVVSSNVEYEIFCDVPWISSDITESGCALTVKPNQDYTSRSAEVVFVDSEGLLKTSVLIVQDAAVDYPSEERAALVSLWEATGGPFWRQASSTVGGRTYSTVNWNTDAPIDTWYGVTLNSEGHVIFIHLTGMGLKGTIPDCIGDLLWLQELWLGDNDLSGQIPSSIAGLSILKDIDLSGNALSGELESSSIASIASHLSCLSLSGNLFTGSFPEWVADMPESANFWLQGNCLEGLVPERVKTHPRWNEDACDGTGRTIGQINMVQRDGFILE